MWEWSLGSDSSVSHNICINIGSKATQKICSYEEVIKRNVGECFCGPWPALKNKICRLKI